MENKLQDGDYVPDGAGGFTRLSGAQALLGKALFRLTCRRGSFPFLPQLGSRLYLLAQEKPSAREMAARQYVAEALEDLQTEVTAVTLTPLSGGMMRVAASLRYQGQQLLAEVQV